jgi:hypothetical protein
VRALSEAPDADDEFDDPMRHLGRMRLMRPMRLMGAMT